MGRRPPACEAYEDAISARLDHEEPGLDDGRLDAHLAGCPPCREYARRAAALDRRFRLRLAEPVPDLTGSVLAAIEGPAAAGRARRPRRRPVHPRAVVAGAAAVALIVGGFFLGGHLAAATRHRAPTVGSTYPGAAVLSVTQVVRKPSVTLTRTDGRPYDPATATTGRVTLLYFGYTHCPNICPINMALTAAALSRLPAAERRNITVLFVTTDPTRDHPSVIRDWLDHFTAAYRDDPPFVGLSGTAAAIHQAEEQVGMPLSYPQSPDDNPNGGYQVVHAGYTLLYSEDGFAHLSIDDTETIAGYVATLHRLVTKGFTAT